MREGETALTFDPASVAPDAGLVFIGRIHTPWTETSECPRNGRQTDALCEVIVADEYGPGLTSLNTCSHIILLYWMHEARRDLILQSPAFDSVCHGTFALRSPIRPNPISLSVVELVKIDGNRLTVRGLDCLSGTPLLDIKPYFASTDSVPQATVGWFEQRGRPAGEAPDRQPDADR
nr:tRNA (N6-threonylcarbamoyladenosine(37)-N6)-methyltransferase TrmO [Roseibium aquae]